MGKSEPIDLTEVEEETFESVSKRLAEIEEELCQRYGFTGDNRKARLLTFLENDIEEDPLILDLYAHQYAYNEYMKERTNGTTDEARNS